MSRNKTRWEAGIKHLQANDSVLAEVIARLPPFKLVCQRNRFWSLASAICSQQISTAAAKTIRGRLEQLLEQDLTPQALSGASDAELREVGLSSQKLRYIRDLAERVESGELPLKQIARFPDETVIQKLIEVHGIGRWTAQMFLIFSLGRLDVFPVDDLGVRTAIRNLYQLETLPAKAEAEGIAAVWRPYATIGSWYCWRSLENS